MKIDVAISHAAWAPGRADSLRDLVAQVPGTPLIRESKEKQHANRWARGLWELIAQSDKGENAADATLILNDDVSLHVGTFTVLEQLLPMLPGEVVSLHGNFPAMRTAAEAGSRLLRSYWPSGPSMVFYRGAARELLNWLGTIPPEFFGGEVHEDWIIAAWLWSKQKPAYVTVPALVRHRTEIKSTLPGFDDHPGRTSPIDWADFPPRPFTQADVDGAPHIAVPWMDEGEFARLGHALRGLVPLCAICHMAPASLVDKARKSGVCRGCAGQIASVQSRGGAELGPSSRIQGGALRKWEKPTFALAIPHAPWIDGRAASLERLNAALAGENAVVEAEIFDEKEHVAIWSERIWAYLDSQNTTHGVQIQDDVRVAPNFWAALSALVQAFPDDIIALHSMHTAARTLAREGVHAYTTNDGLIGVGWVLPKSSQLAFRHWREIELKPGAREAISEDTLLAMFAMATGRRIVSPCPTIIDHDLSLPSSAGHERDRQDFRRPSVTWEDLDVLGGKLSDLEKPEYWLAGGGPVHLGTFYPAVHASCLMHTRSFTLMDADRAKRDECPAKYQRFLRM